MNTWISDMRFRDRLQAELNHAFYGTGLEPRVGNYINIEENPDATPTANPGDPDYMPPTPAPTATGAGYSESGWANLGPEAKNFQDFGDRACPGGRNAQGGCLDGSGAVQQPWSGEEIAKACEFHRGDSKRPGNPVSCPEPGTASLYAPFGKNRAGDILAADGFRARDRRGVPYSFHDGKYQPVDMHDFPAQPSMTQAPSARPGENNSSMNTQGNT